MDSLSGIPGAGLTKRATIGSWKRVRDDALGYSLVPIAGRVREWELGLSSLMPTGATETSGRAGCPNT